MTEIESPRKNNDCYFYYYSTCTKGDNCTFRHEPSALGCETTCSFWKEGKCVNVHCNFRHMELRKNRKSIPCYWETQPGGCKKPHCPFLHTLAGSKTAENVSDSTTNFTNVVDPLVVNFEEESDGECCGASAPHVPPNPINVKTLEEIKLEKVQAEVAALYAYNTPGGNNDDASLLRHRIINRLTSSQQQQQQPPPQQTEFAKRKNSATFTPPVKRQKIQLSKKSSSTSTNLSEIRIKTLAEIKAERRRAIEEAEVSSTSAPAQELVTPRTTNEIKNVTTVQKTTILPPPPPPPPSTTNLDDELLLDDLEEEDCETSSLSLRAEEDILNDIDDLLNE